MDEVNNQPCMGGQAEPPKELTQEEKLLESKKALWAAFSQDIREMAQQRSYLTLTELAAGAELTAHEIKAVIEEMKGQEGYEDICAYQGAKDLYYYSYPTLAHNYVKNVAMAQENDLPRTIAEVVRYESKTYPRATAIDTFAKFPYHYTDIQVKRMLERMAKQEEYKDIETYESKQNLFYIFSTKYLSRVYAVTLIEMGEDKRMWL